MTPLRTAIIAVHGVGSPPKFDTARNVADLLTSFGAQTERCSYPSFSEQFIKIPTAPVALVSNEVGSEPQGERSSVAERVKRAMPGGRDRTLLHPEPGEPLDVAFMRKQLAPYNSQCQPYNTIEIVGTRTSKGNSDHDEVRIYEMHWADLSRVGTGLARVFGALYQLILHIAHIGRKTLDLAESAAERDEASAAPADKARAQTVTSRWHSAALWHAIALRFFTLAVPLCTVLLVSCLLLFLPDAIAPNRRLAIGVAIVEVVMLTMIGLYVYFRRRTALAARVFALLIVAFVIAGIAVVLLTHDPRRETWGVAILDVTTTILVLVAYLAIVYRYNVNAPGAAAYGLGALCLVLLGTLWWSGRFLASSGAETGEGLRFVAFAGLQVSYLLLMAAWLAIWACTVVSSWHLARVKQALKQLKVAPKERRTRAIRAAWTAKVTLTLSLFSFLMTALVGYQALVFLAWRAHGAPVVTEAGHTRPSGFNMFPTVQEGRSLPLIVSALRPDGRGADHDPAIVCRKKDRDTAYDPASCSREFFDQLIAESGTIGLPIALAGGALAVLFVSWFIVLIAISSIHKPKSNAAFAATIGAWVTQGFKSVRMAGSALTISLGIAIAVGLIGATLKQAAGMSSLGILDVGDTRAILAALAIAVLATSATLAATRARLELLASKARPGIGIILDVDNYLRESPASSTPRAQMAERYASLLRHVLDRKDGAMPYFDRIVIVAHSQGTVVSADFLRFLTVLDIKDPAVERRDIRLITMGSPLRQLYAANFPHLYRWIDRTDDYGEDAGKTDDDELARGYSVPLERPEQAPPKSEALKGLSPSPRWLRVTQWVNLYTAGDYVGRPLWQTDDSPGVWERDEYGDAVLGPGRRERCLGDGTHTRYWSSNDVAEEIDRQVAHGIDSGNDTLTRQ